MSELATPAAPLEPFVDAARAADFLCLAPRRVLELARAGVLPGYPLGNGARRVWRFRLTELAQALSRLASASPSFVYPNDETGYGTKPTKRPVRSR